MNYNDDLKKLYIFVNKYYKNNMSSRAICLVKIDLFFDVYKDIIHKDEELYYDYYSEIKTIYKKIDRRINEFNDNYDNLCEIWLKHYMSNGGIID